MALFGLGKKKGGSGGSGGSKSSGGDGGFHRDLRKARKFFDYAETVADTKNYDYSVDCYINGLRHDPDNLPRHEALHEVAKRRKVSGGKPAKAKAVGSELVDKMLTAEKSWAFDPINAAHAAKTMEFAVEAERVEGEEAHLAEVALWAGGLALDFNAQSDKPDRKIYLKLADLFEAIEQYDMAITAVKRALHMKEDDSLRGRLKDLEAQNYTQKSKTSEGQDFRQNIKDADEQEMIQAQLDTTGSQADKLIEARRAEYDEDPEDMDKLGKLVEALLRPQENEKDKDAITLLMKAYENTGQYRYKTRAGDVKIKQFNRILRALGEKAKAGDADAKAKYQEGLKRRLAFELQEYAERVKNYPTDLKLKFELGKRQFQAGQFDDAIGNFQQSKAEPKSRAYSHLFLGKAFVHKGWLDEAVNSLGQGIEQHPTPDDNLGKELQYEKMNLHLELAKNGSEGDHLKQAQALASGLLQTDINYRDIREKMNEIRGMSG
ncbi:MAG: hypothetical protein AAGC44_11145 [Planctomycetota bacterium]